MEAKLKGELGTSTLNAVGSGTGCISNGRAYLTDNGTIFIKFNEKEHVCMYFFTSWGTYIQRIAMI